MITGKQATVGCLVFLSALWGASAVLGRNTAIALAENGRASSLSLGNRDTGAPQVGVGGVAADLYAGSGPASAGSKVPTVPGTGGKMLGGVDDKAGSPPGCTTYKFSVRRDTTYYEVVCVGTSLPWSK